jgi:uncharacterized membrane protein
MSVTREITEIARSLVKHAHDHPPVRDLNKVSDRRLRFPQRFASDVSRFVGSWTFVITQAALTTCWLTLNAVAGLKHWDPYPFLLLDLAIAFEAVVCASLVLMAINRAADRERVRAEHDFQDQVRVEEEIRMLMNHLEAQDEALLEVLQRLERTDRDLRRLARRLGLAEERAG